MAISLYCFMIIICLLKMYDLCFYKAIQHIYWVLRKRVYLFSRTNVIKYQKLGGPLKKKRSCSWNLKITVSGFFFDLKLRKWNINTWKSLWIVVLWSPLILKNQVVEDYFESSLNEWQEQWVCSFFNQKIALNSIRRRGPIKAKNTFL